MEMEKSKASKPPREPSTQNNPPKEPHAYFQPSELVFVISHANDEIPTEQEINDLLESKESGGIIGWSNQDQNKLNPTWTISRLKERELHFPGSSKLPKLPELDADLKGPDINYSSPRPEPQKPFSIIPVDVRVSTRDDKNPDGLVDIAELAGLVARFDTARKDLEKSLNGQWEKQGISQRSTVEVISPNWFASSAKTEYGDGGGPGSRPVPYTGAVDTAPYEFQLPQTKKQLWPEKERRGEGVKVAILDTAPCLQQLVEAYELYQKIRPERQQLLRDERKYHPLIETLLKPGGPLHVHPASVEELFRLRALHLQDHDYTMTDHGLFIAGIINTIAPAAELHLYEVLNSQGTGDLESIARGLWTVVDEQYKVWEKTENFPHLVVNCSLMLDIPLDGDPVSRDNVRLIADEPLPIIGHRLTDMHDDLRNHMLAHPDFVERSGSVIMRICDLLFFLRARVIAAAGNDWRPTDPGRPEARYPAAFRSVQGVGALKKEQPQTAVPGSQDYEIAPYSDLSDKPGRFGVATLGGEAGAGRGVLGIYLGEFPEPLPGEWSIFHRIVNWLAKLFGGRFVYPKNETHWAWWAGTSFATPILSGVIAAVLSGPNPHPSTEAAIVELYTARAIQEAGTPYKEDVLAVTQG
jgi:subtilisin family serine protease